MLRKVLTVTLLLLLAACANREISKDQKLEKSPCACNKPEFINHAA